MTVSEKKDLFFQKCIDACLNEEGQLFSNLDGSTHIKGVITMVGPKNKEGALMAIGGVIYRIEFFQEHMIWRFGDESLQISYK